MYTQFSIKLKCSTLSVLHLIVTFIQEFFKQPRTVQHTFDLDLLNEMFISETQRCGLETPDLNSSYNVDVLLLGNHYI